MYQKELPSWLRLSDIINLNAGEHLSNAANFSSDRVDAKLLFLTIISQQVQLLPTKVQSGMAGGSSWNWGWDPQAWAQDPCPKGPQLLPLEGGFVKSQNSGKRPENRV